MSGLQVISKKNRRLLGILFVIIAHIFLFLAFYKIKARPHPLFLRSDIYQDTNAQYNPFYMATDDASCVFVVNEHLPLPISLASSSVANSASSSSQASVIPLEPPITFASNPKCNKPTAYPEGYEKLGDDNYIGLELNLSAEGTIVRGEVSRPSGFPELDAAALKQVLETWTFEPCKKVDKAIACKNEFKFKWKLPSKEKSVVK